MSNSNVGVGVADMGWPAPLANSNVGVGDWIARLAASNSNVGVGVGGWWLGGVRRLLLVGLLSGFGPCRLRGLLSL